MFSLLDEVFSWQESSSQSSSGELSSSQVELNHTSKPPSRQSSCLSLNSAKVHPEVMPEMKSPGTPTESTSSTTDSADEQRRSHSGSVLAAARSEGSQTETPTYRMYAMSVCRTPAAMCIEQAQCSCVLYYYVQRVMFLFCSC